MFEIEKRKTSEKTFYSVMLRLHENEIFRELILQHSKLTSLYVTLGRSNRNDFFSQIASEIYIKELDDLIIKIKSARHYIFDIIRVDSDLAEILKTNCFNVINNVDEQNALARNVMSFLS